jgi:hypothetical protein
MFGMFQMKGIGFKQIQRKKRVDRALQVVILGSIATGFGMMTKRLLGLVAKTTGRSQAQISVALSAAVFAVVAAKKFFADKTATKES